MINRAMDKIRDEMAAKPENDGVQFLGGWLTGQLEQKPDVAALILADGKTIEGSIKEIEKYASKHRTGNYACVPPDKALEIVAGYYGMDEAEMTEPQAPAKPQPAPTRVEMDDLDLDAMLGL